MAETFSTIAQLCADLGVDVGRLAGRLGLDEQRVLAIVLGRFPPRHLRNSRAAFSAFARGLRIASALALAGRAAVNETCEKLRSSRTRVGKVSTATKRFVSAELS